MATERSTRGTPDTATLAAFLALIVVAGGNAPAIRYVSCSTCELDPFWGAAMRFLLACVLFGVISRGLRATMPSGRALAGAILFGVLQFGAGFGLIYWGLVRAHAGFGQVLIACLPLITLGLAVAHRQERFRWEGLAGGVVAIGGIAIISSGALDEGLPLTSVVAILAGAVCWAEALVVVKGFPAVHPAAMNAIAMGVGTAVLLALSVIFGESRVIPEEGSTWAAQAYLVLAGSVGVFWLYVIVLRRWTASAASYQLVLVPLVTVPVSAWLLDERITALFAAGAVLVLAGVYLGALWRPAQRHELSHAGE